jgi:hypothetical protein
MQALDQLVERRIAEAAARGEFDDLPGAGRPLDLDDDRLVPDELRVAYRLMKNAGYVPDEVRLYGEIGSVGQLLREATRDDERAAASARLRLLLERLGATRANAVLTEAWYLQRLLAKEGDR